MILQNLDAVSKNRQNVVIVPYFLLGGTYN